MNKRNKIDIPNYDELNFEGYILNPQETKSCFLRLTTQVVCKEDNRMEELKRLRHRVKKSFYSKLDRDLFNENFLMVDDVSDSYKRTGKSFIKYEFTLFPRKFMTYEQIKNEFIKISDTIHQDVFSKPSVMNFTKKFLTRKKYV